MQLNFVIFWYFIHYLSYGPCQLKNRIHNLCTEFIYIKTQLAVTVTVLHRGTLFVGNCTYYLSTAISLLAH